MWPCIFKMVRVTSHNATSEKKETSQLQYIMVFPGHLTGIDSMQQPQGPNSCFSEYTTKKERASAYDREDTFENQLKISASRSGRLRLPKDGVIHGFLRGIRMKVPSSGPWGIMQSPQTLGATHSSHMFLLIVCYVVLDSLKIILNVLSTVPSSYRLEIWRLDHPHPTQGAQESETSSRFQSGPMHFLVFLFVFA